MMYFKATTSRTDRAGLITSAIVLVRIFASLDQIFSEPAGPRSLVLDAWKDEGNEAEHIMASPTGQISILHTLAMPVDLYSAGPCQLSLFQQANTAMAAVLTWKVSE
eukprot:scpid76388/ scgid6977/ 